MLSFNYGAHCLILKIFIIPQFSCISQKCFLRYYLNWLPIKFPLPLSEQGGPKHTGAVSGSLTICWPKIKVPLFVFLIRLALGAAGTLPLRKTPLYLQGTLVKATLSLIVTNRKGRQIPRTQVFVVVAFHSPLKMKPNLLS